MSKNNYENMKPADTREGVYVEWDDEFGHYGVFGENSGFCYATYFHKPEAEEYAAERNLRSKGTVVTLKDVEEAYSVSEKKTVEIDGKQVECIWYKAKKDS